MEDRELAVKRREEALQRRKEGRAHDEPHRERAHGGAPERAGDGLGGAREHGADLGRVDGELAEGELGERRREVGDVLRERGGVPVVAHGGGGGQPELAQWRAEFADELIGVCTPLGEGERAEVREGSDCANDAWVVGGLG